MKLAIIAGGQGTRLGLTDIPKPMIKIGNKPLLQHQIELAKRYNINDITILSGHLAHKIVDYFGDGKRFGVHIKHIVEESPLGTAGAVKQLESTFRERFMVFYGDTVMDIDLQRLINYDHQSESIATILVHPNDHPNDSDLVEINSENIIVQFHPKPHLSGKYHFNLVNAALYILDPQIFKYIPSGVQTDFGKDIFPILLEKKHIIRTYKTPEDIRDVGTFSRYKETNEDFLNGKVNRLNKSNKRKAIFLDRDGVINEEVDNLSTIEKFKLIKGVTEATIPTWSGELIPVSQMVTRAAIDLFESEEIDIDASTEIQTEIKKFVKEQKDLGIYPCKDTLVVETAGRRTVIHTFLGSKGNETLGLILSSIIGARQGFSVEYKADPYSIFFSF